MSALFEKGDFVRYWGGSKTGRVGTPTGFGFIESRLTMDDPQEYAYIISGVDGPVSERMVALGMDSFTARLYDEYFSGERAAGAAASENLAKHERRIVIGWLREWLREYLRGSFEERSFPHSAIIDAGLDRVDWVGLAERIIADVEAE